VSHIFNFDVPWQADDYVHRIGRTGRAGKEGRSLTIVTIEDIKQLKDIEKMLGAAVTWIGAAPSAEDLASGSKRRRGRGGRQGARPFAKPREPREAREAGAGRRGAAQGQARARHASPRDHGRDHSAPAQSAARGGEPKPSAAKPQRSQRPPQGNGAGRSNGQSNRFDSKARQPWEPRPPRPQRNREDRTPSPIGLGDHVPAFLKKAPRPTQR
jgi:superfamily II DNA/RNA helicase